MTPKRDETSNIVTLECMLFIHLCHIIVSHGNYIGGETSAVLESGNTGAVYESGIRLDVQVCRLET